MQRVVMFLAVIGACVGCSGSQGKSEQGSVPDYEIASEQQEVNTSNLQMKAIKISTEVIKGSELRRIAEDVRGENADQDALNIEFHREAQGDSEGQDGSKNTGVALVANNDEAANQVFGAPIWTAEDREKIMDENDGMVVISFAQIEKELDQNLQEIEKELEQQAEQDMQEAEKEMTQMEQELERELQEMEKEMEKEMPKP